MSSEGTRDCIGQDSAPRLPGETRGDLARPRRLWRLV
jgi:hypothetical protein